MGYFSADFSRRPDHQFLAGGSHGNYRRMVRAYGGVDAVYRPRGWFAALTTMASAPFRTWEVRRYGRRVDATELEPPVFILGHWRSGTTYLHRLVAQHPSLRHIAALHTMMPDLFLSRSPFALILKHSMPPIRPMDGVPLGLDLSEEDEYALANLDGVGSFYDAVAFPRAMRASFDRHVLLEGVDRDHWTATYRRYLQKVTLATGGGRLVSKNPANTGRVQVLLEGFPGAKFIFIHRHPYTVFRSTVNWLDHELDLMALQRVAPETIREGILVNYERLIRRYLADRASIPAGHLVEVSYDAVVGDPVGETARIWEAIGLEPGDEARARLQAYVASVAAHRTNRFASDPRDTALVADRWRFAYDEWGYER